MPTTLRTRTDPLSQVTRIAVVATDGLSPFHLAVPWLVFGEDRSAIGAPSYDVRLCAERKSHVHLAMGLHAEPAGRPAELAGADLVIVPSWPDISRAPSEELTKALRDAHQRGATLVGLCLGAYALAYAGLLDGRRVTTHWAWADDFRSRFPAVTLDASVLYIDEGGIVTSAGTAAALDCCLHLLRRMRGAEIANRVARRLVVAPHRQGGQAQFIEQPVAATPSSARLTNVLAWVEQNLAEPHSIDSLAAKAAMSRRTFIRHFTKTTGTTVLEWLLQRRLAAAARLLEQGNRSIDAIAGAAGFGSTASFRLHFTRAYQLSPRDYRRQFGRF